MRTTILFTFCLLSPLLTSAADIYVNNSGQSGTHSTITAAIAAASPGDNIYISPYGSYTEDLTIDKDLSLISAVSGTAFNVIGTLTINSIPNMLVKIIGASFTGNFTANTGSAGLNTKSQIYLIESAFRNVTGKDYVEMHVLFCKKESMGVTIDHGEIKGCLISGVLIGDTPDVGIGDTVLIIGNKCSRISWSNDDSYFIIANNFIHTTQYAAFQVSKDYSTTTNLNLFQNNTIIIDIPSAVGYERGFLFYDPNLGIEFYNNIIINNSSDGNGYYFNSSPNFTLNWFNNLFFNFSLSFQNTSNSSQYSWMYSTSINNDDATVFNLSDIDSLGRCFNTTYALDKGYPSLNHYDIDLTPNDRGAYGGPYSIDNYHNTAAGKARVYDLDMPFEIWNGQTPQVKAKAVHTK